MTFIAAVLEKKKREECVRAALRPEVRGGDKSNHAFLRLLYMGLSYAIGTYV